ncbi:exported hypothetical protein [Gammaproteobacteria bacterium]
MKRCKFIVNMILAILFIANTVCARGDNSPAVIGTGGTNAVQIVGDSEIFKSSEETQITKDYVTALVLNGLYRVYKAGLDFTDATAGGYSNISHLDDTLSCAFIENVSLMKFPSDKEFYQYKKCILERGMISDTEPSKIVFNPKDLKEFTKVGNNTSPFFTYFSWSKYQLDFDGSQEKYYPSPLALIYWAIKNIGVNILGDEKSRNDFIDKTLVIIKLINERNAIGDSQYINTMVEKAGELQSIIVKFSKKNISNSTEFSNLRSLHLTPDKAIKLGQLMHDRISDAYIVSMQKIADDKAVNYAINLMEILKKYSLNKPVAEEEQVSKLDDMVLAYNEMKEAYKKMANTTQKKQLSVSGANKLVRQLLMDYRVLDTSLTGSEPDKLMDAFHVGRILREGEGTREYDVDKRKKERDEEENALKTMQDNGGVRAIEDRSQTKEDL